MDKEMTSEQFVRDLRLTLRNVRTPKQILRTLVKLRFRKIGSGLYKTAMWSSKYPRWVVKVFKHSDSWKDDYTSLGLIPKKLAPHWLWNIYVCKRFVVQPLADGVKSDGVDAMQFFRDILGNKMHATHDVGTTNVRWHQGRPVLVDFSFYACRRKPKKVSTKSIL